MYSLEAFTTSLHPCDSDILLLFPFVPSPFVSLIPPTIPINASAPLRLCVKLRASALNLCVSASLRLRASALNIRASALRGLELDLLHCGVALFVKDITVLVDLEGIQLDALFIVCLN